MIKPIIIDYLGKYEGGILVNIGLVADDNYYDAIFFYNEKHMWITVDDKYIEKNGFIQEYENYYKLLEELINMVEPYDKLYENLNEYEK
jgi:hypothetical protein